jgi:membrane protease YdiL (CAAX protease family)
MESNMSIKTKIKNNPVLIYFIITFAISWIGFIAAVSPGGFGSANVWQTSTLAFAVMAMLAGPAVSGLIMISILDGREGYRQLISRLTKWRVDIRWYAVAILTAPVLSVIVLHTFSISCPLFTAQNKIAILIPAIIAGLSTVFEEIGWTGFAVPKLRKRYSILKTGIIVGVLWGLWHLLQQFYISGTYAGEVPFTIYVFISLFNTITGLTAYRILLVWINDRTGSLLLTTLMHASLTASNIFIFRPEAIGIPFLVFGFAFATVQWIFVALVAIINQEKLSRRTPLGVQNS